LAIYAGTGSLGLRGRNHYGCGTIMGTGPLRARGHSQGRLLSARGPWH